MDNNVLIYKNEIEQMCNRINDNIIEAYHSVKNDYFCIALRSTESNYHSKQAKIFLMDKGNFTYIFCSSRYDNNEFDELMKNVNYNSQITLTEDIEEKLKIRISENRNAKRNIPHMVEEVNSSTLPNLIQSFTRNYFSSPDYVKSLMTVFSKIPAEILDAPKKYAEFWEKENKKHSEFKNTIDANLNVFDQSINYFDLYKKQPFEFMEILRKMEGNKQKIVLGEIVKNGKLDENPAIDGTISKEFSEKIAEITRISIPGGKNG